MSSPRSTVSLLLALAVAGCTSALPPGATDAPSGLPTTAPTASPAASVRATASARETPSTGRQSSPGATPAATAVPVSELPEIAGWAVKRSLDIGGSGFPFFADSHLWVVDQKDQGFTGDLPNGEISEIDPESMAVVATVEHARGGFPTVGEGSIWLITAEHGQMAARIALDTLAVDYFKTSTTDDPVPEAVAVAGGYVWVGNNHDGTVAQVDPQTLEVVKSIRVTEPGEWGVRGQTATDGTSVWFGISRTGEIVRIDAATAEEVSRIKLPIVAHESLPEGVSQSESSPPETLIVNGDELWVSTVDHIYVVDTRTVGEEHIVADITTSGLWDSKPVEDDAGNVWSLVYSASEPRQPIDIVEIDTTSRTAVGRIPLEGLAGFGRLVVTDDKIYIRTEGKVVELSQQ